MSKWSYVKLIYRQGYFPFVNRSRGRIQGVKQTTDASDLFILSLRQFYERMPDISRNIYETDVSR